MARLFVYGTLKRGQCREWSWPRVPLAVQPACTLGRLFDLGPYPAMVAGNDRVLGELWQFAAEDMPETLRVLDAIEGYCGQPGDLYRRVVVECSTEGAGAVSAFTYHYARPMSSSTRLIPANPSGFAEWP